MKTFFIVVLYRSHYDKVIPAGHTEDQWLEVFAKLVKENLGDEVNGMTNRQIVDHYVELRQNDFQRIEDFEYHLASIQVDFNRIMQAGGIARCDNCSHIQVYGNLDIGKIPGLTERLSPGGVVPACECEKCSALCYPL